ncbi:MAG: hypothetical protein KKF98_02805 [Bacteroidetes bacterium]|nr:hypothetical protein [Bacteroidota bacterium]
MKNLLFSCIKSLIIGICFCLGIVGTAAIAVTVSTTFSDGDTLSASSLNILKTAVESIPGWVKGTTVTDAVFTTGNVGIGTASPGSKLHIDLGNITGTGLLLQNSTSGYGTIEIKNPAGTETLYMDYNLIKHIGGAPHLQIDGGGNLALNAINAGKVGIGTTSPGSKLSVVGLTTYADNATATGAGLTAGDMYRTASGVVMIVY